MCKRECIRERERERERERGMKADPTLLSTYVATKRRYRGKNVAMRVESTFFALGEDFENKTRSFDGHSGFFASLDA